MPGAFMHDLIPSDHSPVRKELSLFQSFKGRNGSLIRLHNLPKATKLIDGKART